MLHRQEVQVKDVFFERLHKVDRVDVKDRNGWEGLSHDLDSSSSHAEADDSDEDKESRLWPLDHQSR